MESSTVSLFAPTLDRSRISWGSLFVPLPFLAKNNLGKEHIKLALDPKHYFDSQKHRLKNPEEFQGMAELSPRVRVLHFVLGALEQIPILGNLTAMVDQVFAKVMGNKEVYEKDFLDSSPRQAHLDFLCSLFASIEEETSSGLYRVAPSANELNNMKAILRKKHLLLDNLQIDPALAPSLLKYILKSFSPSIVSKEIYLQMKNDNKAFCDLAQLLPQINRDILSLLGAHLRKIAEKSGQMSLDDLAMIFAESILPPKDLSNTAKDPQRMQSLKAEIELDRKIVLDILSKKRYI